MEKERRLIDVNALKEQAIPDYESGEMLIFASTVDEAPTVDAVSRGVHDQVRWERDIAIEQLESYGVSLGEKADVVKVVRCKDCKHYHQYHVGKSNNLCEWGKCKLINMDVDMPENGFCCFGERRTDG